MQRYEEIKALVQGLAKQATDEEWNDALSSARSSIENEVSRYRAKLVEAIEDGNTEKIDKHSRKLSGALRRLHGVMDEINTPDVTYLSTHSPTQTPMITGGTWWVDGQGNRIISS